MVVVDEQQESQKGKKRDEGEASLEGFESRNFEQMSGSIAFDSGFILIIRYATYRFLLPFLLTVSFPRLIPSFASSNSSSTINTTSAFGFRVGAPCFQM